MHYYSESIPVEKMTPEMLDDLLALGWYRMSDCFFTTSFIRFETKMYNTVWLRIALDDFVLSPTLVVLKKKNKRFRITYQKLDLDDEMEVLFASYKSVAKFETAPSLLDHLYSKTTFDNLSYTVKIYDGDLLIGCGIYEKGITALEGLISFYHADYAKHSLGKYLILTKIEYAKATGCQYYYLGYYVPGYTKFDYKLDLSKNATEYFHPRDKAWYRLQNYDDYYDEINIMRSQLRAKEEELSTSGAPYTMAAYPFYDMNIFYDFGDLKPLMMPYFILFGGEENLGASLMEYIYYFDTRQDEYKVARCHIYGFVPNYTRLSDDFFGSQVLVLTSEYSIDEVNLLIDEMNQKVE